MAKYIDAKENSTENIPERIRDLIAEHLMVDPAMLREGTHFLDHLGADWLDRVELINVIETEFGLEFSDADIDKLQLVGDLIHFVQSHAVVEKLEGTSSHPLGRAE